MKQLREYDLSNERILTDKLESGKNVMLLVSHQAKQDGKLLMSQTIPYANLLDNTRLFKVFLH